jgi:hypothetical protein
MNAKKSIFRWACCIGFGMSVGFLYFIVTWLLGGWGWNHKIGDKAWVDAISWVLGDFPFGFWGINWFSDGKLAYLLNGLFWASLAGGFWAFKLSRKNTA